VARALNDIFASAEFLPDSIDFAKERLNFVHADRSLVEQLPFIDGREPFGKSGPSVPLADALAVQWERPRQPDRYIFHVGFCGSTFLATVLQHAGAFALREPRVLVDLADAYTAEPASEILPSIGRLIVDLLRRPWRQGQPVICKPSNWFNNAISLLCRPDSDCFAIFLTATPLEYLLGALRGGTDRIENIARTAHHMLASMPDGKERWSDVMGSTNDPLDRAARLALVTLESHLRAFKTRSSLDRKRVFQLTELDLHPVQVVSQAAEALQLKLSDRDIESAIQRVGGVHAKQPDASFTIRDRQTIDRRVEEQYGEVIRAALDWAEHSLEL
jgi:hypothetical protein